MLGKIYSRGICKLSALKRLQLRDYRDYLQCYCAVGERKFRVTVNIIFTRISVVLGVVSVPIFLYVLRALLEKAVRVGKIHDRLQLSQNYSLLTMVEKLRD